MDFVDKLVNDLGRFLFISIVTGDYDALDFVSWLLSLEEDEFLMFNPN